MIYRCIRIVLCYLFVLLTISLTPLDWQGIYYFLGLITLGKLYYDILKCYIK